MIFLSAQPDEPYFIWQLEIQLLNFREFGIKPENIHVLLAYDAEKGLNYRFLTFVTENKHLASFFFYPDLRKKKHYLSSIRPNVIKQHFSSFPELSKEAVFYHDSDIVFTCELPDFERLCADDIWYFSDTRSYLGTKYIEGKGSIVLTEMCEIIGIDPELVRQNDENAGGAQAILKCVDAEFWAQIEDDCENLYTHLYHSTKRYTEAFVSLTKKSKQHYTPISSWCSDMWALLWNAFKRSTVRIDRELDFCWPHYNSDFWNRNKIFHNAGITHLQSDKSFYKGEYTDKVPYDTDFSFVSKSHCSFHYVRYIKALGDARYYQISDATVILSVDSDFEENIVQFRCTVDYLCKYFKVNVLVLERGAESRLADLKQSKGLRYFFLAKDKNKQGSSDDFLIQASETDIIIAYDYRVIIPASQLYHAVLSVRENKRKLCYPYDAGRIKVNKTLSNCFFRDLDVRMISKYAAVPVKCELSYDHCFVADKNTLIDCGVTDDELCFVNFHGKEIYNRVKILGYLIRREPGVIYHLQWKLNTEIIPAGEHRSLAQYQKYIKICNMKSTDLKTYLAN